MTSLRDSANGHLRWVKPSLVPVSLAAGSLALPLCPRCASTVNPLPKNLSSLARTLVLIRIIVPSWITRLPTTFAENGLASVVVDRRKFAPEIATLLLDTWMMASQEIATNVLDKFGEGRGDVARKMIEEVGGNRGNTAFNLQRVITVGKKEE